MSSTIIPTSAVPELLVFEKVPCCLGSVINNIGSGTLVLNSYGLEWTVETPSDSSSTVTDPIHITFSEFGAQGTQQVEKPEPATFLFIQRIQSQSKDDISPSQFYWFKLAKETAQQCYTYIIENLKKIPQNDSEGYAALLEEEGEEEDKPAGHQIAILDENGNPIFLDVDEEEEEEEEEEEGKESYKKPTTHDPYADPDDDDDDEL